MKTTICDICHKPIMDIQHKIKIKKEVFSFQECWLKKLDVCEKCADRIIYNLEKEINNEKDNTN